MVAFAKKKHIVKQPQQEDKYGRISFTGPRMYKTFDDEYECSLGSNCHEFIAQPSFAEFHKIII